MSFHKLIKDNAIDLEQFNHEVEEYHQGWQAADQYAYNVLTEHPDFVSGQRVKDACARYVVDRTLRDDIEFRTQEADNVVQFANKFRHVKGKLLGKPIRLMLWMQFVLCNIFGWYYTKGEKKGERRFTKAFTLVARGNAKSFLCSIVALYTMLFSPNGNPSCYSVARNAKQAGIVFRDAKAMLKRASANIRKEFRVMAAQITSFERDGIFEPLAADSQSVDGLRVALGICDELHAHHDANLMNTLITGTSATIDSLIFSISTAGIQLDGICIAERNLVRLINENIETSDGYIGIEFSIDDDVDWKDEKNWAKANPSLGHAVQLASLREEFARALQTATNRKDFLTKYLNVFVNTNNSPYLDVLQVQSNCARSGLKIKDYIGKTCYIGLDLAQKLDLAALSIMFPEKDGKLTIFQRHYLPESALEKATPAKYDLYTQWEEDGILIITPTVSTDFEHIKSEIRWCAKNFDLEMVGYDPYAASQMALALEDENITMVEVRQSISSLSEPAKLLQSLIAEGKLNYQEEDKCFEWCCANAAAITDTNENLKVVRPKDKPHDKIDSVIALITGLQLCELRKPKPKNPYMSRGLLST